MDSTVWRICLLCYSENSSRFKQLAFPQNFIWYKNIDIKESMCPGYVPSTSTDSTIRLTQLHNPFIYSWNNFKWLKRFQWFDHRDFFLWTFTSFISMLFQLQLCKEECKCKYSLCKEKSLIQYISHFLLGLLRNLHLALLSLF